MRKLPPLGPYRWPKPKVLGGSEGVGRGTPVPVLGVGLGLILRSILIIRQFSRILDKDVNGPLDQRLGQQKLLSAPLRAGAGMTAGGYIQFGFLTYIFPTLVTHTTLSGCTSSLSATLHHERSPKPCIR